MNNARIQSKKHVVDRGVKQLRGYRYNAAVSIPYDMKTCELDVDGLGLTRLPPLPHNLHTLICSGNNLETLPTLPPMLTTLSCENNILKSLPTLPKTLQSLTCYGNFIKEIPELPASLTELVCFSNELKFLPDLKNVKILIAQYNPLNPLFTEMVNSANTIHAINEFHRNMRAHKERARDVINVPILKDRLPEDLLNIVGSFMSGKNTTLVKQLNNLCEAVAEANDSLQAEKNEVRKRYSTLATCCGWWLKWHKEKHRITDQD